MLTVSHIRIRLTVHTTTTFLTSDNNLRPDGLLSHTPNTCSFINIHILYILNNFGYKDFGLYLLDRLHNLLETTNIFEECDEGTIQSFVPGTAIVSMGMKEMKKHVAKNMYFSLLSASSRFARAAAKPWNLDEGQLILSICPPTKNVTEEKK